MRQTVEEFIETNPDITVYEDTGFGWRWSDAIGTSMLFPSREAAIRDAAQSLDIEIIA